MPLCKYSFFLYNAGEILVIMKEKDTPFVKQEINSRAVLFTVSEPWYSKVLERPVLPCIVITADDPTQTPREIVEFYQRTVEHVCKLVVKFLDLVPNTTADTWPLELSYHIEMFAAPHNEVKLHLSQQSHDDGPQTDFSYVSRVKITSRDNAMYVSTFGILRHLVKMKKNQASGA